MHAGLLTRSQAIEVTGQRCRLLGNSHWLLPIVFFFLSSLTILTIQWILYLHAPWQLSTYPAEELVTLAPTICKCTLLFHPSQPTKQIPTSKVTFYIMLAYLL